MNTTIETIKLFWQHAARYPWLVAGLAITMPLTLLIQQFLPPLIMADMLNRLSKSQFTPGDLWGSFGGSIFSYTMLVVFGTMIAWRIAIMLIWRLEANVQRDMAQRIFAHLLHQSANFHADRFGGSLVSQTSKLLGAYVRFADTTVFQLFSLLLAFAFTAIILWPRTPVFVIFLLVFSTLYMLFAVYGTRFLRKLNAAEATAHSKQTGYLADSITNVMAVKSFAAGNYEQKRFAKATEQTRQAVHRLMHATTKRDLFFSSVNSSIEAVALAMAAASVVLFNADVATVFLVLSYTGNIGSKLWDFSASTMRNYNRSFGDAKDMVEILHIEPEIKDPAQPEPSRIKTGAITFDAMSFTHAEAHDPLFKNLVLTISPGEKVGLVGHSGSGKTTLTKLLLRYSDIDSGQILIDGQDIAAITQDDLRGAIAYVPQEPQLFHRSIQENIAYGKPGATEAEIIAAAHKAHATEFIDTLPKGYRTLVGERGIKLSGGQRQRIAIARAILKDAPILVLDEATSALDSESEYLIQDALWQLMNNRTTIVIAHRLSTVQKMDRIIVLDKGAITEQGNHAELLQRKGAYAALWAHQSGGFIEE